LKLLCFVIVFSVLLSCGKKAEKASVSENLKIAVSDSLAIEIEAKEICANDTHFFASETYDSQISCFDYQGNKMFSVGAKGSGPGEFTQLPFATTLIGNYIVSADIPAFKIEIFNKSGEYYKSINYQEQRLAPIHHMFELNEQLYIEAFFFNMKEPLAISHKLVKIDIDNETIQEESVTKIRELASFEDVFKKMNPFELEQKYYSLEPDIAKIINLDLLRIYSGNDSTDISLASIPLEKVTKEIIDYLNESISMPEIKLQFPEYLPKINNLFHFDGKLLLLSEKQKFDNQFHSTINRIYCYAEDRKEFVSIEFPTFIPVHKIAHINKNRIFVLEEEKVKIYECKFES
jgi:hypothetical protein